MTQQELIQQLKKENQLTKVMGYIQSGDTAGLDSWIKTHNSPLNSQQINDILGGN